MPEDDLKFQGLIEADAEKAMAYPDINIKLPGVELASIEDNYPAITVEEESADFQDLAAAALGTVGIDTVARLRAMQIFGDAAPLGISPQNPGAALVEANNDKIVYKITFNLPDIGLADTIVLPTSAPTNEPTNADPLHNLANVTVGAVLI